MVDSEGAPDQYFDNILTNLVGLAVRTLPFEKGEASAANLFEERFGELARSLGIDIQIKDVPHLARFGGESSRVVVLKYQIKPGLVREDFLERAKMFREAIDWAA